MKLFIYNTYHYYLMGNNATKDIVVKIIEVIPEEEPKKEVKPKTIKKASKK